MLKIDFKLAVFLKLLISEYTKNGVLLQRRLSFEGKSTYFRTTFFKLGSNAVKLWFIVKRHGVTSRQE